MSTSLGTTQPKVCKLKGRNSLLRGALKSVLIIKWVFRMISPPVNTAPRRKTVTPKVMMPCGLFTSSYCMDSPRVYYTFLLCFPSSQCLSLQPWRAPRVWVGGWGCHHVNVLFSTTITRTTWTSQRLVMLPVFSGQSRLLPPHLSGPCIPPSQWTAWALQNSSAQECFLSPLTTPCECVKLGALQRGWPVKCSSLLTVMMMNLCLKQQWWDRL